MPDDAMSVYAPIFFININFLEKDILLISTSAWSLVISYLYTFRYDVSVERNRSEQYVHKMSCIGVSSMFRV